MARSRRSACWVRPEQRRWTMPPFASSALLPLTRISRWRCASITFSWKLSGPGSSPGQGTVLAADTSLKNQFLLAMPGLTGSYFGASITYICEHNADGAMGLVINKPGDLTLVELLAQIGLDSSEVSIDVPVLDGGPVATERGFILHTDDKHFE